MNYKFFKLIKNKILSPLNLLIEKFYNFYKFLFIYYFYVYELIKYYK